MEYILKWEKHIFNISKHIKILFLNLNSLLCFFERNSGSTQLSRSSVPVLVHHSKPYWHVLNTYTIMVITVVTRPKHIHHQDKLYWHVLNTYTIMVNGTGKCPKHSCYHDKLYWHVLSTYTITVNLTAARPKHSCYHGKLYWHVLNTYTIIVNRTDTSWTHTPS